MKKLILLGALILATSGFCQAVALPQQLSEAENVYRAGHYAEALQLYEQDLKNHPNDPYLYYNIGNCYFKMGSTGLAAANYFRAFKLAPRNADIRHNLSLALASGGEQLVPSGVPEALHKGFFILSLQELQGLTCLAGWCTCLLAGLWLLTRRGGKWALAMGTVLLVLAGWFYVRHSWQTQPLAVVASPVTEVRSGPGTNFPASAALAQGHLVEVLDHKDNWQEVVVKSQGLEGWVESDTLERI